MAAIAARPTGVEWRPTCSIGWTLLRNSVRTIRHRPQRHWCMGFGRRRSGRQPTLLPRQLQMKCGGRGILPTQLQRTSGLILGAVLYGGDQGRRSTHTATPSLGILSSLGPTTPQSIQCGWAGCLHRLCGTPGPHTMESARFDIGGLLEEAG